MRSKKNNNPKRRDFLKFAVVSAAALKFPDSLFGQSLFNKNSKEMLVYI
jgi:hypothetical protein